MRHTVLAASIAALRKRNMETRKIFLARKTDAAELISGYLRTIPCSFWETNKILKVRMVAVLEVKSY